MSQVKRKIIGPYLRTERTTRGIMLDVLIALTPALLGGIYFFGMRTLLMTAVGMITCMLAEYIWQRGMKQQITVGDFSAALTGMLIAFNMPVTTPLWIIVIAGVFAIVVVKQMFGGIGSNFANPALMGRLLIMIVWPGYMMQYSVPATVGADAVSSATVLAAAKAGGEAGYSYWQMFIGEIPGAIGETSKLLLLIGFVYLCYKQIVNVSVTVSYIVTVLLITFVIGPNGFATGDILLNLFGGGLVLGACYMLTDYSFVSRKGKIIFGIVAGIITAGIRIFTGYPEGVCYGILIANCLAGLLAMFNKTHIYGVKQTK